MIERSMALRLVFLVVLGMASSGCSGSGDELPREPVSGTVSLDGEPVADGMIQFTPSGGSGVGGGARIQAGSFSILRESGLVPGSYQVSINAAASPAAEPSKSAVPKKGAQLARELIPAKYNSQTKLAVDIKKGGASDLKFDLQSK